MRCGQALGFLLAAHPDFFAKIVPIIPSHWRAVTGHFAPGSVLVSCHIISCFVQVTLALNRRAAPAAAVIRKMFISKWSFFNRNTRHIVITAQLGIANSFLSTFSPRLYSSQLYWFNLNISASPKGVLHHICGCLHALNPWPLESLQFIWLYLHGKQFTRYSHTMCFCADAALLSQ